MDIITTEHLTKSYGKNRGIIDLSFSVGEGEFFGFIGPNGAGKSTTIRTLLGLIRPTSGKASVFGTDVSDGSKKILENIGYIPSEAMFYSGITVSDILCLSARLRKKDCMNECRNLCERLQLDPTKKTEELSLGNRKKLSIVCALQHNPKLCIFDEPTSGLDPLIQKEFFDILQEHRSMGTTIFLSSHVLSEVQTYCNRAAVIREGKLVAYGDMTELARTNAKRISITGCHVTEAHLLDLFPGDIRDFMKKEDAVSFLYQGNIRGLLQTLVAIPFTDITVTEPDLNEIFMHFYK